MDVVVRTAVSSLLYVCCRLCTGTFTSNCRLTTSDVYLLVDGTEITTTKIIVIMKQLPKARAGVRGVGGGVRVASGRQRDDNDGGNCEKIAHTTSC